MALPIAEHLEKSFKGKKAAPFKAGGGRDEEHENDAKGRKRKKSRVQKTRVVVPPYVRADGTRVDGYTYDTGDLGISPRPHAVTGDAKRSLRERDVEMMENDQAHRRNEGLRREAKESVARHRDIARARAILAKLNKRGAARRTLGKVTGKSDQVKELEAFLKRVEIYGDVVGSVKKARRGPEPANEKTKREEEEDGKEAEPGKEDSQQEEEADEAQGGKKRRQKVRDEIEKRIEKAVVRVPGYTRHDGTHVDGYAYETTDGPSGLAGRIRERLSASGRHNRAVRQMTNDVARRRAAEYRRPQVRADYNRLRRKHLDGTISAKEKAQMYALKRELTGRDPQRPQQETGKIDVGRNPMMSVPAPTDHALPGQHGPGPKRLDKSPVGDPYATPEENAREAARIAFEDWAREKLDAEEIAGVG